MSYRELLELAAKAAGEEVEWRENGSYFYRKACEWPAEKGFFNPLHDDGEALRLAMKLDIVIHLNREELTVICQSWKEKRLFKKVGNNTCDADVRKCIVQVAAQIGRAMP